MIARFACFFTLNGAMRIGLNSCKMKKIIMLALLFAHVCLLSKKIAL